MVLSTPPSRVATNLHRGFAGGVRVSIHATLAGGDDVDRLRLADLRGFYPRHPRGWRPGIQRAENGVDIVSIHATLAGGDQNNIAVTAATTDVSIHATLAGGDIWER